MDVDGMWVIGWLKYLSPKYSTKNVKDATTKVDKQRNSLCKAYNESFDLRVGICSYSLLNSDPYSLSHSLQEPPEYPMVPLEISSMSNKRPRNYPRVSIRSSKA